MNIDKNAIKCFRCDRRGHNVNECRTSEQHIIQKPEVKRKYIEQVKFYKYCKLNNYDISEYQKLKRNLEGWPSISHFNDKNRSVRDIRNNILIIAPVKSKHKFVCETNTFCNTESILQQKWFLNKICLINKITH